MDGIDHDLTVVIPAFDEEVRLSHTLPALARALDQWRIDYRVLIVDDGSRDNTAAIANRLGPRFSMLRLGRQQGKGAAIRCGMLAATGRVVGFTDADLPYELDAFRVAHALVRAGEADVAFGARDLPTSECRIRRRLSRRVATWLFRRLVGLTLPVPVSDPQCALKVFSRAAARAIFSRTAIDGFAFDTEVVLLARQLHLQCRCVPVVWMNDDSSRLSLWRHTVPMLTAVFRLRVRWFAERRSLEQIGPAA